MAHKYVNIRYIFLNKTADSRNHVANIFSIKNLKIY